MPRARHERIVSAPASQAPFASLCALLSGNTRLCPPWSFLFPSSFSVTQLLSLWDRLRGSFWFLPSAMAIVAIMFSFGLVQVDSWVELDEIRQFGWLYTFGPEGARAVLSAIASSMITVAGLTFFYHHAYPAAGFVSVRTAAVAQFHARSRAIRSCLERSSRPLSTACLCCAGCAVLKTQTSCRTSQSRLACCWPSQASLS